MDDFLALLRSVVRVVVGWLPIITSVLGSGVLVTTVKALVDGRVNSNERQLAQREAEVYAKLDSESQTAHRLEKLLDLRASRWYRRELRRGWLGYTAAALTLLAAGSGCLYWVHGSAKADAAVRGAPSDRRLATPMT